MSDGTPASYEELASVIESLPILMRETRRARGLSIRAAAQELGVAGSTVLRIENGTDYNSHGLPTILRWLGAK